MFVTDEEKSVYEYFTRIAMKDGEYIEIYHNNDVISNGGFHIYSNCISGYNEYFLYYNHMAVAISEIKTYVTYDSELYRGGV